MAPLSSTAALAALFSACLLGGAAAAGATAAGRPPASSELALLRTIRVGLDPAGTVLSSWQPSKPCGTWRGLTCDIHGRVTSINFGPSVTFTGALVSAIGSLPYLTTLYVRTDGFRAGSRIPTSIGKLSKLKTLVLSGFDRTAVVQLGPSATTEVAAGVGLVGPLPAGVAALPALTYLDLSNNTLGGLLPPFAGAAKLQHLDLSGNRYLTTALFEIGFQGPAPTFSANNALTLLNLASNNFSTAGNLSVLRKLKYLNLAFNSLTSFAGADITSPSLTYLSLGANLLQGALPDLAHVKSLRSLDLSNNVGLTGALRADYGSLTNLRLLSLYQGSLLGSQQLQGPIPASYGALSNLRELTLSCPSFNSSVDTGFPPALGKLRNLRVLTIGGGLLSPPPGLPAFVGGLIGLQELEAYDFVAEAYPSNLANLKGLTRLKLGLDTRFVSASRGLPQFVLSLESLQTLDLSENSYSGRVWGNLRVLTKLNYIDLSYNSLSGAPADVLSAGPSWRHVALPGSGLQGPLPATIGSLKSLQYLAAEGLLTGALPASISRLTALQYLDVSSGALTGGLPDLSATKLKYLLLPSSRLSGPLPKLPTTLHVLSAFNNNFTTVPEVFTGLDQLLYVDLTAAGPAVPSLPASLFRLPRLQTLTATGLGLKSIPADIGGAAALTFLDLSYNRIAQKLPAGVPSLRNLRLLFLHHNNFTGGVPSMYFASLTQLLQHDVSYNQLTGPLPLIPTTPDHSLAMSFSHNAFSGTLPPDYFDRASLSFLDVSHNQLSGPLPNIYDFGGTYPGALDYNYFTGRPVVVNTSTGGSSCIGAGEFGVPPSTSYNCLTFAGTNCTVTPQKPAAECAAFCGDTSASGPCAGHGTCSLRGSVPTCTCDSGYETAAKNNATCVRVTGHHPPGQGHRPPGQGHHSPPPAARRLMQ